MKTPILLITISIAADAFFVSLNLRCHEHPRELPVARRAAQASLAVEAGALFSEVIRAKRGAKSKGAHGSQ